MSEAKEFLFKILLCGDGAVGKTSIREQYMGKGFGGSYMKTIGADFASHKENLQGNKITYQIFDLAGQDAYRTARKSFYKGGQAAFLIFDLQDPASLNNLKTWIDDCIENSGGSIQTFVMLGNKADLIETRQVSNTMAIEYGQRISSESGLTFIFLETSAKTGLNIKLAFEIMGKRILQKFNVNIPLDLPEGIELITPGAVASGGASSVEMAAATASAAESSEKVAVVSAGMDEVVTRLEAIEERLDGLDKRFGRLAMLVKKIMDESG